MQNLINDVLDEADKKAAIEDTRYTHEEVFSKIREKIDGGKKL